LSGIDISLLSANYSLKVTVYSDLAVAVVVGVIVSALVYAWNSASHITAHAEINENQSKEYMLFGPLFFGSVTSFNELFDYKNDPKHVVIDFKNSRVWDHSGLQAIDALAERYQNEGKKLHLLHLSDDYRHLLTKAGSLAEVSVIDDPDYGVAVDYFESYHDLPAPTDIRQG
jgi:sulfate permease, SulP family